MALDKPDKVVKSWNDKQATSNLKLSGLVPFVSLVAIFTEREINQIQKDNDILDGNFKRRLTTFELQNDSGGTFADGTEIGATVQGIQIGAPEDQLGSFRKTGGSGINSLNVTRGTKEALNVNYDIGLTIADVGEFDIKEELTSLVTLNTNFLIMYGWSGGSDTGLFTDPPVLNTPGTDAAIPIDLQGGDGYWKAVLARLYKFEYDFDEAGFINARIGFMAPHNAALTFMKMSSIAGKIRDGLFDNNTAILGGSNIDKNTALGVINEREAVARSTSIDLVYEEEEIIKRPPSNQTRTVTPVTAQSEISAAGDSTVIVQDFNAPVDEVVARDVKDMFNTNTHPKDKDETEDEIEDLTTEENGTRSDSRKVTTKRERRYFYLGWIMETIRDVLKDDIGAGDAVPKFWYEWFGNDEAIGTVYNKFYRPVEPPKEGENGQFQRKDASDSIVSVFEIPIHLEAVVQFLDSAVENMSILDAIQGLLDPSASPLVGIQLAIRNKDNLLQIFVASVTQDGVEQELGINAALDITPKTAISVTFGAPNSLTENIAMSSQLDPNAHDTYKLQVNVGNTIQDLMKDERVKGDILDDLKILYNQETVKVDERNARIAKDIAYAKRAGTYESIRDEVEREGGSLRATTVEGQYTAQSFISKYIAQDARNFTYVQRAFMEKKDIFANILGLYLRRTTISIHGTSDINAYESILVRGLVRGMEGVYTILQVTDQVTREAFTTNLECSLRKPLTEIPGAQSA